jgi:hypothetical protein
MYVDIRCGGDSSCAEVDSIGLILMLVEDIQCKTKTLSEIDEMLREENTATLNDSSIIRRKAIIESTRERYRDMVISILIKSTDDHLDSIRTLLDEYADHNSRLDEYNLLEMIALGGKTDSVIKLEEQYLESEPRCEMA